MIKAPFKRKSMPPSTITVTPEKTPRAKRAASATRSLNSLAASSVNSLSDEGIPSSGAAGVGVDDDFVLSSTNPIVVIIDGEVQIRDKDFFHSKSVTIAAASATKNNNPSIEVEDTDAFPEELMNNSKNNLLMISSINCATAVPEDKQSVSDDDDDDNERSGQGKDSEEPDSEKTTNKPEDQVPRSVKVARLKKKLKTKVLGLSNQLKETQQMSSENGNEIANKMMKYFSKADPMENDKLISDDACSSKMNSPVHQASSGRMVSPILSPSGAKRKQKAKKNRLRIKSPIGGGGGENRSKDDHLIDGGGSAPNKSSIRNVIFSSFRNYTKSSGTPEEVGKKEEIGESDYLQPIEVNHKKLSNAKSTLKKNIKSKLSKRFNMRADKLKTCKMCEKKCRRIHSSRTVLDFKKELKSDELFDSEFCTCTNSISIKNFNEEYFEEIEDDDFDDHEDNNIKNHLYSEIDGVSKSDEKDNRSTLHFMEG